MNISRFFIDRPIFAGVLSIVIFLAGAIAITRLPVSEYPDVVPPSIVVRATYPGANPKVIAETVAAPLEEQINGVENLLYMSSQANTDGVLTLTVTFKIGTDPELAETQVQNRVQRALPRLPDEVRQIGVITQKSSPDLTMVVHILSPDSRYDELYLRNYAVLNVKDVLQRIPGMGQVLVFGAGDYADARLARSAEASSRNLTASDVTRAIREQNKQVAAGVVGAAGGQRHRVPAVGERAGPADDRGGVRQHHRRHLGRRRRAASEGRRAHRARCRRIRCAACSTTSPRWR
jgi:multidrug efflux pump